MTQLIVALDFADPNSALVLLDQLDPKVCAIKVGSELFTRTGPDFVTRAVKTGFRVFLDLKFHDIPNTVAQACKAAADLGVWMLNVHASGGLAMMSAAREALESYTTKPLLIAVTVLTSFKPQELNTIGIDNNLETQVRRLALLAQEANLDGVVCSAQEVCVIKAACAKSFLTVTPGIRLAEDTLDDQVRVVTPQQAKLLGSDYIVMGRSITKSLNPASVVEKIIDIL